MKVGTFMTDKRIITMEHFYRVWESNSNLDTKEEVWDALAKPLDMGAVKKICKRYCGYVIEDIGETLAECEDNYIEAKKIIEQINTLEVTK